MYDKSEWVDIGQNIFWGGEWFEHYKSPDGKYDILHIKGQGKELNRTVLFPVKEYATLSEEEASDIVNQVITRLFI